MVYRGQAEREFRVEVEAIGHVRHKNLVRLLGYCVEGVHRYQILSVLRKHIPEVGILINDYYHVLILF